MKVPKGQKVPEEPPHDVQKRLGAAIKEQRRRLGVTQEELAWRADMHRTYLADVERGSRNVTLRSITNLARALQVSVSALLSTEPSMTPQPGGAAEILLVEDEASDAELTRRAFRRAKIANPIKLVRKGRPALDYLFCVGRFARRQPVAPALVLLDLRLPDMSGLDVLREMRARPATRQIPVVVLTGTRDDRAIMACSRLGAAQYIIKPVEFDDFSKITPKLDLQWAFVRARRTRSSS